MTSLTICCASNREEVLRDNLARSPAIGSGAIPLISESNHPNAGSAYNAALARTTSDVVVFAHQDIYLPAGWEFRLRSALHDLQRADPEWGVLGIWGVCDDG